MLHGHLPILISRLSAFMRHVNYLYHSAARMVEVGFYSIQSGRRPKNWRQTRTALDQRRRPRPWLIHYHIFKNAGSSFEWALKEALGEAVHVCDPPSANEILPPAQIASYVTRHPSAKIIISHQAVLPAPKVRGCAVISSLLIRDPIARVRSIYAFERLQDTNNLGARKAKELDFKGYVEWRLSCSAGMFCNYQVYFCSRMKDTSPHEVMTEAHLERAIKNLDNIDIIGTVERYDQWLGLAQSVLSNVFSRVSLSVAHCNVTGTVGENGHAHILDHLIRELGADLAERLLKSNHLDMRLHQVADALLTRRLAEHGVGVKQLDAYIKAWEDASARGPEESAIDR